MITHYKTANKAPKDIFSCVRSPLDPYTCGTCSYESDFMEDFKTHSNSISKDSFVCKNCSFATFSQLILLKHVNLCKNDAKLDLPSDQCPHCQYRNDSKLFLDMHIHAEHNESGNSSRNSSYEQVSLGTANGALIQCGYCSFKCGDIRELQRHSIKKHTSINLSDRLTCGKCSFMTQSKSKLEIHKKAKHGAGEDLWSHYSFKSDALYQCGKCCYKSRWRSGLEVHKLKHKMSAQERRDFKKRLGMYECPFCPYMTRYRLYFNNHVCKEEASLAVTEA